MKILYVDGVEMFAKTSLFLLEETHPDHDRTIVYAGTFDQAVEALSKARFDLVISSLAYEGQSGPRSGGIDLYKFVCQECGASRNPKKVRFCFMARPDPHEVLDLLEEKGLAVSKDLMIFKKGIPLYEIINRFMDNTAASDTLPERPEAKTTQANKGPSPLI